MSRAEVYLVLRGHDFYNEAQTMTQVFYPNRKYIKTDAVKPDAVTIVSAIEDGECAAFVHKGGILACSHKERVLSEDKKYLKNLVKICILKSLNKHTGIRPKWGILTGIRPSKLARELMASGKTETEAIEALKTDYYTSAEKAELAVSVATYSSGVLSGGERLNGKSIHLYAGIPFCPTTCLYCSFTSYPISKYREQTARYLDCLKAEIDCLPDVTLRSVYVGGGTPTSLDADKFERLLSIIAERFTPDGIEYTIEAGRPDTISAEKLRIMKRYGVNRLSINPQTMNDETLRLIGRSHLSEDIQKAFEMAREAGFSNINMDLIVGLPGENTEMLMNTMERILALMPDSITVHTLAVKRASRLNENLSGYELSERVEIDKMLELTRLYARKMDMLPYSMYRQKNTLGNFENVGYCRDGCHSVFNIETLEETGVILAAGAGAVTKIVDGNRITRIFNIKNVDEYMSRIDEAIGNKLSLKLD